MKNGPITLTDILRCPERRLDASHYDLQTGLCAHQQGGHVPAPILRYFDYDHLPPHLQKVSEPFYKMAHWIDETLPTNAETSTALRKLLESKDAAVRAALDVPSS
jgi:hypothetical protein